MNIQAKWKIKDKKILNYGVVWLKSLYVCIDKMINLVIEMRHKHLLMAGLALVFTAVALRLFSVEFYAFVLIPGIALKVIYLILGLLNGRLAGGLYLGMLFAGIAMVGGGSWMKSVAPNPDVGFWIMMVGFLLKAVSIVFMVVVGRKRRLAYSPQKSQ